MSKLEAFAARIRIEQMKCFKNRGFGHIGGALSITDTLAALYGGLMNIDPERPDLPERDRLVCSKGHAGPALYATLALKGYFPLEWLETLNQGGTRLPSHCDRNLTPGIDMTTGSLGQGGSAAAGMAHALKATGSPARVYLIVGDGECDEGQVWEMILFAATKKLSNLTMFIDYNHMQLDGRTEDICDLGDMVEKLRSFGWEACEADGHDPDEIARVTGEINAKDSDKPRCVVLNTEKGHGVARIAAMEFNHHIYISEAEADEAIAELEAVLGGLEEYV